MNKKIIVIGAGHGGLVAAIKLALAGNTVEIYEKNNLDSISYPWYDDIRFDCFELSGITPPQADMYAQKAKWSFISPDELNKLAVPQAKPMEEVSIDRRRLAEYLLSLAEKNCKIYYNSEVESLYIEDGIVKGIIFNGATCTADMIIDASGLSSPFKAQLPATYNIPSAINEQTDIMYAYRAFFKRVKDSANPDTECTLYLKHLGVKGISWCNVSPQGNIDILIGRVEKLSAEEVRKCLSALRKNNPVLSEENLQESYAKIAVRHPLSVMVADNYAAIGDSAFMTMPLMGSGIESSMKSGKILADTIIKNDSFTAEALWEYQVEFYKKIGSDWAFIDVLKNWMLGLDNKIINWIFKLVLTSEDLALINTDKSSNSGLKKSDLIKKIFILLRKPAFVAGVIKTVLKAVKAKKTANKIPQKYQIFVIKKWQSRYEKCFK